jgi:hypothetical protein
VTPPGRRHLVAEVIGRLVRDPSRRALMGQPPSVRHPRSGPTAMTSFDALVQAAFPSGRSTPPLCRAISP